MIAPARVQWFSSIMHCEKAPASAARLRNDVTGCPGGVTARTAYRRGARFEPDDVPKLAGPFATVLRSKIRRLALQSAESKISRRFDVPTGPACDRSRGSTRWSMVGSPEYGVTNSVDARREADRKKKKMIRKAKRGATRGLPRGSPILVLLSPKHA